MDFSDRARLLELFKEWGVSPTHDGHGFVVNEGYSGIPISFMFTKEGAFIGIDCDISNQKDQVTR